MTGRGRGQGRAPPGTWPPADEWGYPDITPGDEDRWLSVRPTNPPAPARAPATASGHTSSPRHGSARGSTSTRGRSPTQGSNSIQVRGSTRAPGQIPTPGDGPAPRHTPAAQGYPRSIETQNTPGIAHIPFQRFPWPSGPLRPGDRVPEGFLQEAQDYQDPVVFSWNAPSENQLPTNHAAHVAWYQGPRREWIAFDTRNGTVRLDIQPFSPTPSIATHPPTTNEPAFEFRGYGAESEAFMPFFRAGLIPYDRNLSIRWVLEGSFYRARRLSTGQPDHSVEPDLFVEGHPHLTVQQYLAMRQEPLEPRGTLLDIEEPGEGQPFIQQGRAQLFPQGLTHIRRPSNLQCYQQDSRRALRDTEQRLGITRDNSHDATPTARSGPSQW
ncbi:MAG: hypothetical protein Q9201_000569 [Fulgogasparrea decipioides]